MPETPEERVEELQTNRRLKEEVQSLLEKIAGDSKDWRDRKLKNEKWSMC